DVNDTQIAKLESGLKGISSKVEAYLLESVFLGGLAFSGFLAVASQNFLSEKSPEFSNFCVNVISFCNRLVSVRHFSNMGNLVGIFHPDDLLILIMFLCLFCSVFFLLVLTLRMRFMS